MKRTPPEPRRERARAVGGRNHVSTRLEGDEHQWALSLALDHDRIAVFESGDGIAEIGQVQHEGAVEGVDDVAWRKAVGR